ncbi:hypothetical protein F4809DRAFT_361369 [Biscogniauxia mediterranea]|nr:hypothetical protein F4809DRAFT_361369 [Biscogniauxia mediterranea]
MALRTFKAFEAILACLPTPLPPFFLFFHMFNFQLPLPPFFFSFSCLLNTSIFLPQHFPLCIGDGVFLATTTKFTHKTA